MRAAGAIRAGAAYVEVFLEQNALSRSLAATSAKLRGWSAGLGRLGPPPAAASCQAPWPRSPTSPSRPPAWSPACWPPCGSGPAAGRSLPGWPRRPAPRSRSSRPSAMQPGAAGGFRPTGHGHPPHAGRHRRGGPGHASGQQGPGLNRRQRRRTLPSCGRRSSSATWPTGSPPSRTRRCGPPPR